MLKTSNLSYNKKSHITWLFFYGAKFSSSLLFSLSFARVFYCWYFYHLGLTALLLPYCQAHLYSAGSLSMQH